MTKEDIKERADSLKASRTYVEADLTLLTLEYDKADRNAGALGCAIDAIDEAIKSIDSAILYLIDGVNK